MRLHRLDVTAFGPFATAQTVDFERLGQAGLFLLHGPTGAGKTSVLDAVCYALYGSVPGTRRGGLALRSELADPHRPTEVVLDLTVGGRRLEITRLPEQPRPKKRGSGTTVDKPRSRLRERLPGGDGWKALSTSHQEIGEEIGQLLGMSKEQFCQVVLLPQGEFARFLRADAEARAHLLGRLFDTGRFAALEDHLAARRRATADEVRAADERLLALAHRMAQAAGDCPDLADPGVPGPAGLVPGAGDDHEPPTTRAGARGGPTVPRARAARSGAPAPGKAPADETRPAPGTPGFAPAVLAWAAVCRAAARERLAVAEVALAGAEAADAEAARIQQETADRARLQARHADATRRAAELASRTEEMASARQRIERTRAAAGVAPALAVHEAAVRDHEAARATAQRCRAALPAALAGAGAEELAAAEDHARRELGSLAAARRAEQRAAEIAQERAALEQEAREDEQTLLDTAQWLAGWDDVRAAHQRRADAAQEAAARAEHLAAQLEPARARAAAAVRRDALAEEVDTARARHARTRAEALDAYEHWLDLKDRRLRGIAAELAGSLTDGAACPVCGSTTHPEPARPLADHVDRAAEDAALTAHRRAERARQEADGALQRLREELAAATAAAGDALAQELAEAADELRGQHARQRSLAADLQPARSGLARAEREYEEHRAARQRAERAAAARTSRLDSLEREAAAITEQLSGADGAPQDVAGRARSLEREVGALADAVAAVREERRYAARREETTTALSRATTEAGFADAHEASAALLDDDRWRGLQQRVDHWHSESAVVRAELEAPDVAAAAQLPPADVWTADEARRRATTMLRQAANAATAARDRCAELDRHAVTAADDARRAAPLREEHDRVARLAALAAGTSADNRHRMRLESYVLAARLEQVAAAASTRLHRMSGGRYTLVHSDERSGARRAGLGLHVVDAWTGRERDTSGLSGGETFFASLALALGLADVVTDEAGGTRLDTLFIDEGFGSLDEQTLDDVLDVLDSLRERDRSVGIVSHVPDLRRRIPAQLEVVKDRAGSAVRHRVHA